jgi:hypothetical protein
MTFCTADRPHREQPADTHERKTGSVFLGDASEALGDQVGGLGRHDRAQPIDELGHGPGTREEGEDPDGDQQHRWNRQERVIGQGRSDTRDLMTESLPHGTLRDADVVSRRQRRRSAHRELRLPTAGLWQGPVSFDEAHFISRF